MSLEEKITINIEETDKSVASFFACKFADKEVKNRAFVNALSASLGMKYLSELGFETKEIRNLHYIRKILEEIDIADIELPNIHIDVRAIFNENEIFIPKSHLENNILPDIYLILKLNKHNNNGEFLGFVEPRMINRNNENSDYYFIEKEKLSPMSDLKAVVETFGSDTTQKLSDEEMEAASNYMFDMLDNNISDTERKTLLQLLLKSRDLRDNFTELENFETISYSAVNDETLTRPEIKPVEIVDEEFFEEEVTEENENSEEEQPNDETETSEDETLELDDTEELTLDNEPEMEDKEEETTVQEDELETELTDGLDSLVIGDIETETSEHEEEVDFDKLPDIDEIGDITNIAGAAIDGTEITKNFTIGGVEVSEIEDDAENFADDLDTLFDDPDEEKISESQETTDILDESTELNFDFDVNDLEIDNLTEGIDEPSNDEAQNLNIDDIDIDSLGMEQKMSFDDIEETPYQELDNNFDIDNKISFEDLDKIEEESQNFGFGNNLLSSLNSDNPEIIPEPSDDGEFFDENIDLDEIDNLLNAQSQEDTEETSEIQEQETILDAQVIEETPQEPTADLEQEYNEEVIETEVSETFEQAEEAVEEIDNEISEEISEQTEEDTADFSEVDEIPEEENFQPEPMEENPMIDLNELDSFLESPTETIGETPVAEEPEYVETSETEVYTEPEELQQVPEEYNSEEITYDYQEPNTGDEESLGMLFDENLTDDKIPEEYEDMPETVTPGLALNSNKSGNKNLVIITASLLAVVAVAGIGFAVKSKLDASQTQPETQSPSIEEVVPVPEPISEETVQTENIPNQNIKEDMPDISEVPKTPPVQKAPEKLNPTPKITSKPAEPPVPKQKLVNDSDSYITVKNIVWQVPDYLSYSDAMRNYLNTAGKSIKLSLSSDLLLATEYAYSNQVKVNLKISNSGSIQNATVVSSSGSTQIDKIVLQSVKSTLNVVKPPVSVIKTPEFNLTITIYL